MEIKIEDTVKKITEWLEEKKAEMIKVYDVRSRSDYTDMIMVCEGSGDLHNRAIAQNVLDKAKEESIYVLGKEGMDNGTWILIDMVTIVVHVFDHETREYYDLEELWEVSDRVRKQKSVEDQTGKEN
ncbi:MAG: ribosome silencing factor [Candidatus Stygibacter australis]|nr:ribosome silencing factor [Candidatus Stygibacter australis]MDP8321889.1 ribosome silencing factor [Candidatus Stygibacter australis]